MVTNFLNCIRGGGLGTREPPNSDLTIRGGGAHLVHIMCTDCDLGTANANLTVSDGRLHLSDTTNIELDISGGRLYLGGTASVDLTIGGGRLLRYAQHQSDCRRWSSLGVRPTPAPSEELLCPKRRPYKHVRRCPYGAPECPTQRTLYGHTIRRMPFHVLRLVHTKLSNVLVTYFYVPKNKYRNIRILKTLPIPILPFLLLRLPLQVIQDGHRPVSASF